MRGRIGRVAGIAAALALATAALPAAAGDGSSGLYGGIRAIGSAYSTMSDVSASGFAGPTQVQNDSDQVAGPAGVIGWRFKDLPIRAEVEGGYRVRFDLDVRDLAPAGTVDYETNVATAQVLFNAMFEWRNSSSFTPFIGGTVGWARNSADTQRTVLGTQAQTNLDNDEDNLAWGVMAGVDWRFLDNWSADVAYRFIDLGEVSTGTFATGEEITADHYYSHDVLFSLYYRF